MFLLLFLVLEKLIKGCNLGVKIILKGGSPNSAGLRKSIYTEELALKYKIPLVRSWGGGGSH